MRDQPPSEDAGAQLRRIALIVRQGLYFVADEIGREYGMQRPCKCDQDRRRRNQPAEVVKDRKAA